MEFPVQLFAAIYFISFFCNSPIRALSISLLPQLPLQQEPVSPPPPPTLEHPIFAHTQLAAILGNLGFQELAMALPSLPDSSFASWNSPATLFAPSDESIRSCQGCNVFRVLKEHTVSGMFSYQYLAKLTSGIKLETMSPGRCITLTNSRENSSKILIDGVEIAQPDLLNDGHIVIHGLQSLIAPLSPFSCNPSPPQTPSTPLEPVGTDHTFSFPSPSIMRLMLRDAMIRLCDNGYSILSLAFRVKHMELVNLQSMTVFALDDSSILSGGHSYVNNVRFHIVPNQLLMHADLLKLPIGTSMQTLVRGESLVVTNGVISGGGLRINYVPLKNPDTFYNLKIVVHTILLPFPHLHLPPLFTSRVDDGLFQSPSANPQSKNGSKTRALRVQENKSTHQLLVEMEEDGF